MNRRTPFANFAVLALVNLLWAAQYPAYKVASESMAPSALGFWTFLIALVMLLPFLARQRRLGRRAVEWRRAAPRFVVLAVLGLLPPSVLMAWGIERSTASNASILALTIPVLMVIMGVALLGERLTVLRAASVAMALAGTVLISISDLAGASFRASMLKGNLLMFFAGAGSAFYNTYSKRLLRSFSELEVLVYGYAVACALCASLSLVADRRPFYSITGYRAPLWGSLLVLGGVSWGVAMVIWLWALGRLEVTQVSASVYLLPLFGLLLSAATLGERLGLAQVAGGALVLAGTYVAAEYEDRRARAMAAQQDGSGV